MTDYPSKLKAFLTENPQYLRNYPAPEVPSPRDTPTTGVPRLFGQDGGSVMQEYEANHVGYSAMTYEDEDSSSRRSIWQDDRLNTSAALTRSAPHPFDDISLRSGKGGCETSSPMALPTRNDVRSRNEAQVTCPSSETYSNISSNGSLLNDNAFKDQLLVGCTTSAGGGAILVPTNSCPLAAAGVVVAERNRLIQELPAKIS